MPNEVVLASAKSILAPAELHAQTEDSIAQAVLGLVHSARLSVTAIGTAWARVTNGVAKHGVKQVDRLESNPNFDVPLCQLGYVRTVLAKRRSIVTALDWTEFALDGHSTICLSLITKHGRATPLVWLTVETWTLKDRRNAFEDDLLRLFKECLPERPMVVIVLADRGFGDVGLYAELEEELGFEFVIRFRCNVLVEHQGRKQRADEWLRERGGHSLLLRDVQMTHRGRRVQSFVALHEPGMKEAWFLASSLKGSVRALTRLYSMRFTIEETFRDQKDLKFGWGLYETQVTQTERRDRLLLLAAVAQLLLTLVGVAGESLGLDAKLRVNTEKRRRTQSLFRQGREYIKGLVSSVAHQLQKRFEKLLNSLNSTTARFAEI